MRLALWVLASWAVTYTMCCAETDTQVFLLDHPDESFDVLVSSRLNQFMVTEPRKRPGRDVSV